MEAFAILVLINIHVYMLAWYRKLAKSGFAKVLINFGGFGEPSMNKHTCIHTHLISEGRKLRFRPGCPKCLKTLTETKVRDILFGPGRISRFLGWVYVCPLRICMFYVCSPRKGFLAYSWIQPEAPWRCSWNNMIKSMWDMHMFELVNRMSRSDLVRVRVCVWVFSRCLINIKDKSVVVRSSRDK